jgi:hypothetical protein
MRATFIKRLRGWVSEYFDSTELHLAVLWSFWASIAKVLLSRIAAFAGMLDDPTFSMVLRYMLYFPFS